MDIEKLKYEAVKKALHIADVSGSAVLNMDCIDVMKQIPDNFFNLAIVDPPYGLKIIKNGKLKANSKFDRGFKKDVDYGVKDWDNNVPTEEYWRELFRVSKNQIVWGGNFFLEYLGNTKCYVTWFKKGKDKNHRFSPTEWAWTSFTKKPMYIDYAWIGFGYINQGEKKIHPTHKPIYLYDELLKEFASEGDFILDTHLGGGSSRISSHKAKMKFIGIEIDAEYFEKHEARWKNYLQGVISGQ